MTVSTVESLKEGDLKDQENSTPQGIKIIKGLISIHTNRENSVKPAFPFIGHPISLQNFRSLSKFIA